MEKGVPRIGSQGEPVPGPISGSQIPNPTRARSAVGEKSLELSQTRSPESGASCCLTLGK